jgi:hypothetical protein
MSLFKKLFGIKSPYKDDLITVGGETYSKSELTPALIKSLIVAGKLKPRGRVMAKVIRANGEVEDRGLIAESEVDLDEYQLLAILKG